MWSAKCFSMEHDDDSGELHPGSRFLFCGMSVRENKKRKKKRKNLGTTYKDMSGDEKSHRKKCLTFASMKCISCCHATGLI